MKGLDLQQTDVVIIGAGPSGSSAAALLRHKGYQVVIIEKQHFLAFRSVNHFCHNVWCF